jgi:hypothetical protein
MKKVKILQRTVYLCVMSGFRREVAENCALLGHYAAISGNFLPTLRENLSGPTLRVQESKIIRRFLNPEDGTR